MAGVEVIFVFMFLFKGSADIPELVKVYRLLKPGTIRRDRS